MRFWFVYLILLTALCVSCREQKAYEEEDLTKGVPKRQMSLPDPNDVTVAFYRGEKGNGTIRAGKLHSYEYRKIGIGQSPSVSPTGRFVAFNPTGDVRFPWRGIHPVLMVDLLTGTQTEFKTIPPDTAPAPGCAWSQDEELIAFGFNNMFHGKGTVGVLKVSDSSYWWGYWLSYSDPLNEEFNRRYPTIWRVSHTGWNQALRHPCSHAQPARAWLVDSVKGDNGYYHWPPNAVYYKSDAGIDVRISRKDMWIAGTPIWLEKTHEILFLGVWHSDLHHSFFDPDEDWSATPNVYLINPEKRGWVHASKEDWDASIICRASEASCSD